MIVILNCITNSYCQKADSLQTQNNGIRKSVFFRDNSIEVFFHLPYHFLHSGEVLYHLMGKEPSQYNNYWNYGFGGLLSCNIGKVKIGTGFYYSTKNYYRDIEDEMVVDKIHYYNIPILITIQMGKLNPSFGIIFNHKPHYNNAALLVEEMKSTFWPPAQSDNVDDIYYKNNYTFRIGCIYKYNICESFSLLNNIFLDYRFYDDDIFYYGPIVEGRFTIGLNIGLDYNFNQNTIKKI